MNQPDAVATAGCLAKVFAVRSRNTMITYTRASTTKIMNNFPAPPPPIHALYRQWNDLHYDRHKSTPKSCTPPTRIAPTKIHTQVGPHPKYIAAKIGPTIGPAPAIDEKW